MGNSFKALNHLNSREESIHLGDEFLALPAIYQAFVSNYTLGGELELFRTIKVLLDANSCPVEIRWENSIENSPWKIEGDRLLGMLTIEELKYEMQDYYSKVEPWHQSGMIKIGWTHGDVILLGIEGEIIENVFLYGDSTDGDQAFTKIAEDIFSMFSRIELIPDAELLEFYNVKCSELYNNWGEPFWRMKTNQL
jgi:hypothetical protein